MEKIAQGKAGADRRLFKKALEREREKNRGSEKGGPSPKLILIEPSAPGIHIYSTLRLPRLGTVLLGTIAKQMGWDVRVYVEEIAPVDYKEALTADLVGISSITSTASRAYAIADAISEYGIPVVMGGPHVTFLADEALEHCDFVVRGEGEYALPALMRTLLAKGDLSQVPNLSYRDASGTIRNNDIGQPVENLDSLPFPDMDLIHGRKIAKGFLSARVLPILTSRGCPFGCTFCSVIEMFGRKMRFRSEENVIEEMRSWDDRRSHVFFYDDNFTASKKRAKKLMSMGLKDAGLCGGWSAQVRTDVARDPELLALMHKTGCDHVYIGFESVNPEVLKNTNKRQEVSDMFHAASELKKHRIGVHGMFVFGFDSDTEQTIEATRKFAMKSGIKSAQFLLLTPLPGTPLFNEMVRDGRITAGDWSRYDAHHVTFSHDKITPWQLQRAAIFSHERFYSHLRTAGKFMRGEISAGLISLYASRLIHQWKKGNRTYLKAMKLAEKAKGLKVIFEYEIDFPEIRKQVENAARSIFEAHEAWLTLGQQA